MHQYVTKIVMLSDFGYREDCVRGQDKGSYVSTHERDLQSKSCWSVSVPFNRTH